MSKRYKLNRMGIILTHPFRKTYIANKCDHETKQKGFINNGESESIMEMPLTKNGKPDYCLACIGKMSIKCAWCGKPISIGSPVTLYSPGPTDYLFFSSEGRSKVQTEREQENFEVPKHAVVYSEDPLLLVGCLGLGCADTGADICGRWMPPGEVERTPSPVEIIMASVQKGQPCIVMMGDTRDPSTLSTHPID